MKILRLIGAVISAGSIVSVHSSASAASFSTSSSASNSSGANSELTFTGNRGIHKVNEDVLEVKDGTLEVNGVSYGKISDRSIIKYTVQGNEKTIYVDGVVRKPVP